jgi:hypothetical protein
MPIYAALAVLVIGWLAYWLSAKFIDDSTGRVAGFSMTIGILLGKSAGYERSADDWPWNAVGAVVGLVALWWLFFKRGFRRG